MFRGNFLWVAKMSPSVYRGIKIMCKRQKRRKRETKKNYTTRRERGGGRGKIK